MVFSQHNVDLLLQAAEWIEKDWNNNLYEYLKLRNRLDLYFYVAHTFLCGDSYTNVLACIFAATAIEQDIEID